ncbi:hypothetical protein E1A91_A06G123800v1 [Gossypium mustelinum]|uniref:Retrotransposon gag domain-containing protein n=1 Tax=Gossypium mustelinum TaxID=34275 RepID=A0A5D2YWP4_GOSMU|nr:hypothetical protein E1A91_A06G123800v1 [Gossypium mustelinum]
MAENQENPLPPAIAVNQNPAPCTMYDYAKPNLTGTETSIVRPAIFVQFDGFQDEDPNTHLANFLEFCNTFKINGAFDDAICLRLFPFSLRNKAKYLNPLTRQMIGATVGGTINNKTPEVAYEFIEEMSLNNYQWHVMRTKPTKVAGVFNLDAVTILSNQVEVLNIKIDGLCSSDQVHPVMRPQHPPGFQQPPYQQKKKPNLEEMLTKFISVPETHFQNTETALMNQQASIQGLETQIGQLAKLISERAQGSLPNNTESNPREQEIEINKGKCENKLPNKLKDPGSFTIPYLIGSLDVNNALADLGASINVMPYKMFKQLGLGKPKQTRMSIQLADKTIRFPRGIIEDVLIKIDKFIFPVDFIVLDIKEDSNTPLILGRPFLVIAKTIIDVGIGELTLRVGDETITLQAHNSGNTSEIEALEYRFTTQTRPSTQACLRPCGNRAKIFPSTGYDKLPRPCDMAVGEPAKTTRACDMSVP